MLYPLPGRTWHPTAGAWHSPAAAGPGWLICPWSAAKSCPCPAGSACHCHPCPCCQCPLQTGIKSLLKQPGGWGYLYFWCSLVPLLSLYPLKGKEHPCLRSPGNCPQKGTNLSLRPNWEWVFTGECCSAVSTPSSRVPVPCQRENPLLLRSQGQSPRQKHCSLNYHVQKQ